MRVEDELDLPGAQVLTPPADDLLLPAQEVVEAVVVLADEVAGVQPTVAHCRRRLFGEPVIAEHDRRVAQQQLARRAGLDRRALVVDDERFIHTAQPRVLAEPADGAVRRRFVTGPDHPVRRLGQRVAAGQGDTEAVFELEVAFPGRCRPAEADPGLVPPVVVSGGRLQEHPDHGADDVELCRPRPADAVPERAEREALEERERHPEGQRSEGGVRLGVEMEEGQAGEHVVVGAEPEPGRKALAGHDIGPLGLHHELRLAGRARRLDEHGRVVPGDRPADAFR